MKIAFPLDLDCGKQFTLDPEELNYLKNQEHRNVLFFNGLIFHRIRNYQTFQKLITTNFTVLKMIRKRWIIIYN
ncbi:MAG: hypothetical protein ACFFCE_12815 [Promethearchaeota archaeon]